MSTWCPGMSEVGRKGLVNKTIAAVKDRLTEEIAYWDHRAEVKAQEQAGKINARRTQWRRADELQAA